MQTDAETALLRAFGVRVRELRDARGLSQERLGQEAALHRTYIGSLERGERNVSMVNLYRLATALGVPAAELLPRGD